MASSSGPPSPALVPRRRSNGIGTLHVQTRSDGRQLWYGRWYVGSRRLNRRIGLKRKRGTGQGLTKLEAEAELRRMMLRDRPPQAGDEITFATAAELMLRELEELGRKPTTLANYRQIFDFRLLPRFGEIPVGRVKRSQVETLAFGAPLARRRLGREADTRTPQLRAWILGDAKVAQRRTLDRARKPGRRSTQGAAAGITLPGRRGPRLRQPDHRRAAGSRVAAAPL